MTQTNFDKVGGGPEDVTVPNWLSGTEAKRHVRETEAGDRGLKPDIYPRRLGEQCRGAERPYVGGAVQKWKGENGHTRRGGTRPRIRV